MKALSPAIVVVRLIAVAIVAGLLQLGAAAALAHQEDHCAGDDCFPAQCDMAAGNGCSSPCAHAPMQSVAQKALDPLATPVAWADSTPRSGVRRADRPFRPPALA